MSAINELVNQIEDTALRERIAKEVDRLSKQKKFGLVFEEHLPECTPLYDIPVKVGALVAKKAGEVNDVYKVLRIEGDKAQCLHRESKETAEIALDDLVTVAEFGESNSATTTRSSSGISAVSLEPRCRHCAVPPSMRRTL